jgi:GTP pyrophosphokinase
MPALTVPLRAPEGTGGLLAARDHQLMERVRAYAPAAPVAQIEEAFNLACQAHSSQTRDNGDPYITHPLAVAEILAGYHLDVPSICTALLHDTVEDTSVTMRDIERGFGPTIAGLVDGVTKLTRLELQSDRTKQAENFRKLVLAMSRDIRVLLVKLADRLHNMRTLNFVQKIERRHRIAHETMDIYAPLAARIGMDAMKTELQNRSFAELEPDAHSTIQARLNYLRGQGADVIDEVKRELAAICREGGVDVQEVSGREKSAFSIWQKMQMRNVAFEQLSDIMAFRIVVPTREQCYMALGAVHNGYPVIAGRFKDYISTPKANGYQSLHTGVTLRHPRNQKIEVQIRTAEMHNIADNGVAAHWNYKEGDTDPPGETQRIGWVQDLLEILDNSGAPDEFLENTKLELYQDQVFCFTPKGQLIQLPRGATPIDFAYAVHSQVGDTTVGAKINGRLMPLRHELQNGDQVEIMTARGPRNLPSLLTRPGTLRTPGRDDSRGITGLVAGMAVHYAGCCHPLPGDPIVGIVTTGKGVTIHTSDCPTLETFAATPERFIDVDWDAARNAGGQPDRHLGRISVIAGNENGVLSNLANAVARHDGGVSTLKIVNRQQDFMEVLMDVEVRDLRHLGIVIAGLRAVSGITQVERAQA